MDLAQYTPTEIDELMHGREVHIEKQNRRQQSPTTNTDPARDSKRKREKSALRNMEEKLQ